MYILGDSAVLVGFVEKRRFDLYNPGHVSNSHHTLVLSA